MTDSYTQRRITAINYESQAIVRHNRHGGNRTAYLVLLHESPFFGQSLTLQVLAERESERSQ